MSVSSSSTAAADCREPSADEFFDDFGTVDEGAAGHSDGAEVTGTRENCDPQSVIGIIAREISAIADDIENLPAFNGGQLNDEQITLLQNIDFCSQRLKDISTLVGVLDGEVATASESLPERMVKSARIEHIRDLFSAKG